MFGIFYGMACMFAKTVKKIEEITYNHNERYNSNSKYYYDSKGRRRCCLNNHIVITCRDYKTGDWVIRDVVNDEIIEILYKNNEFDYNKFVLGLNEQSKRNAIKSGFRYYWCQTYKPNDTIRSVDTDRKVSHAHGFPVSYKESRENYEKTYYNYDYTNFFEDIETGLILTPKKFDADCYFVREKNIEFAKKYNQNILKEKNIDENFAKEINAIL